MNGSYRNEDEDRVTPSGKRRISFFLIMGGALFSSAPMEAPVSRPALGLGLLPAG